MDSNELRELQAPLKEKYREDPGSAVVTLTARGDLADGAIRRSDASTRNALDDGSHQREKIDEIAKSAFSRRSSTRR